MRVDFSSPIPLSHALNLMTGEMSEATSEEAIFGITTDSREAQKGYLFFALDGRIASGEDYVEEAVLRGGFAVTKSSGYRRITVADPLRSIGKLAAGYKDTLPHLIHTVAITGSNGKTTTKNFLGALLSEKYKTHATSGNFNNLLGVSLTILSAPKDTEALVLEVGMNHPGEIAELSEIIRPSVAAITNIGSAHIGILGSREKIAEAKMEITNGMYDGNIFVSSTEPLLSSLPRKITLSRTDSEADFFAKVTGESVNQVCFDIFAGGSVYPDFVFNISGRHNFEDLLFALAIALHSGVDIDHLREKCAQLSPLLSRQRILNISDFKVLDDSYNASLESVSSALELLMSLDAPHHGALLGDILELGDDSEGIHKEIGRRAFTLGIDRLYLFGELSEYIRQGAIDAGMDADSIFYVKDANRPDLCKEIILNRHRPGEIILIKASHEMQLDRIIEKMKKEVYDD